MPGDDFFDADWEDTGRTQETAPTGPAEPGADEPSRPPRRPRTEEGEQTGSGGSRRAPRRPRTPRGGGGGGSGGGPSLPPLEWGRIALVAGVAIVVLLILLFAVRSCGGSNTQSKTDDYFKQVNGALKLSNLSATQFRDLIRAPRPMPANTAVGKINVALKDARAAVSAADAITPTKQLEPYHRYLEQALAYRVNGLECWAHNLPTAYTQRRTATGGAFLVPCSQRFLASDVVYNDSYAEQASAALRQAHLQGPVPTSVFMGPELQTLLLPAGSTLVLERLKPGAAVHGLHGVSLDSVIAQTSKGNVTLQPDAVNKIKMSDNLSFVANVKNGGNFEEFDVVVQLTLGTGSHATKKTATITQIAPGATQSVTITGVITSSDNLQFGPSVPLRVYAEPVPGERTTSNNGLNFKISFSL